ncbi:hypothetical protein O6H91_03G018700 [Diphasiastrum complanatum]|uniref:Uncharacterized protein n=1 Tax=Diphasiastrum complanatum TaxID=34168 RepID=A0ACC2E3S7_DIPCM|nr:hypothetical protein O6H91_03G018700 [Diphasiastrum complanatum]
MRSTSKQVAVNATDLHPIIRPPILVCDAILVAEIAKLKEINSKDLIRGQEVRLVPIRSCKSKSGRRQYCFHKRLKNKLKKLIRDTGGRDHSYRYFRITEYLYICFISNDM